MYLLERILSLAIYVFILILICIGLSHTGKRDNHRLLRLYIVILSIMGYSFVPHAGADLSRLILTMHFYSSKTLPDLVATLSSSSTPGVGLYFYIVGKLGNDKLLPCISALITFTLCFRLLHKQVDEEDVKADYIACALFVFMSRGLMMQIISNIRTIMALSICAWCIYAEFYKHLNWKKLIVPYILAASLHLMGQAMLVYRLAYLLIEKGKSPTQKIIRTIGSVAASAGIWIFGGKYITHFITQADGYYSIARQNEGYSYVWEGILCVVMLIILIYTIASFRKQEKIILSNARDTDIGINATNKLINYIIPLIGMDVAAGFVEFNFFQRTNWFLTILMIPLIVQLLRVSNYSNNNRVIRNNLVIMSLIMLVVACARGDLCSLKFFVF